MENQTRFDLNASIEKWRQELAAQLNLSPEDRRELETHLRDTIAGFQQSSLNDEESFWLARRRVGQPQQLEEEFVKADPAKVWRERVFWMWLAIFLYHTLAISMASFSYMLMPVNTNGSFVGIASTLLGMWPILMPLLAIPIVVLATSVKANRLLCKLAPLIKTRLRVAISAFAMIAFAFSIRLVGSAMYEAKLTHLHLYNSQMFQQPRFRHEMFTVGYLLVFALMLVLLAPKQYRKSSKRV